MTAINEIFANKVNTDGIEEIIRSADLERVRFYASDNRIVLDLHTSAIPPSYSYHALCRTITEYTGTEDVRLNIHPDQAELTMEILGGYIDLYLDAHVNSAFRGMIFKLEKEKDDLLYYCHNEVEEDLIHHEQKQMEDWLHACGFSTLHIVTSMIIAAPVDIKDIEVTEVAPPEPAPQETCQKKKYYHPRKEEYESISLHEIEGPMDDIQFEGEVFGMEEKETRKGRLIQTFRIYDGTDAIVAKRFEGRGLEREEMQKLKDGCRVHVYGRVENDTFLRDLCVSVQDLTILPPLSTPKDNADPTRVEWHMHTYMSEMDGVCDVKSIVQYAHDMGLGGIVITDHADVQSLKKAYDQVLDIHKADGNKDFKCGFGCEMNMADDHLTIVRNPVDLPLDDTEFVSFDLETTGLSCYYDSIIEFGAVKVKNYAVVDRLQMFIKPPFDIPPYITAKTNISNAMVADAKPFKDCCEEIIRWIGDDPIVAHNATFDYYFLNEELRRIGRPALTNCVIDTLDMSRAILRDKHVYRLGNISHYYHVQYDEDDAHRADYDAEALAGVFFGLVNDAKKQGCTTIRDLQDKLQNERDFEKVRKYHICVVSKNEQGIRDLYKLVTESNIKTLAVGAKSSKEGEGNAAMACIRRSSLAAHRENLLFGTACYNSRVFELACNGDDARLEKEMSFYDYVEVQPLSNFTVFLAERNVPSKDRLKDIIRRIIRMAKKLGKPIIADSDAHYCNPAQKIFRDVYITAQGVGGAIHPLYIRNDALRLKTPTPDQHIRTTEEMKQEFAWLEDPELIDQIVVQNTRKLFEQLEDYRPVPAGTYPPKIPGSDEKLREICWTTCKNTYEYNGEIPAIVKDRLEMELDNIIRNGYGVHYYIAHLLVKKSNDDGYIVGSRGSVGSSFTATMAGITEVNSLEPHYLCPDCHYSEWIDDPEVSSGFDLPDKKCPKCGGIMKGNGHRIPFQTFLGFNADKVPDIDLNFSGEYQWRAHAFIGDYFGRDHAFRAGTIGTVAEKTALGYVSGYCEKMHIENMRRPMKEYLAAHCVDVKRTTGQHAGGIIIIPNDHVAEDFTPIQYPANDPDAAWMTTHYDFHDIHDNVLKFDILGHVDPTAIRLLQEIADRKPLTIPFNDPETLSLFSTDEALHCDPSMFKQETGALGLPEFGTAITRRVLAETRPKKFSDLIIISGLTHGTDVWAGNAEELVKAGHPLTEVIGCRDDIMNYLLSKNLEPLHAFTIMEKVRKGKGLTDEQEKDMRDHDVPDWYIDSCKKIKYMFPRAHAVAYCMMAFRLGWYKVHEPHNFYIQYLTLRCDAYEIETMCKGFDAIKARMDDIDARRNAKFSDNPVSNKEKALYEGFEVMLELYARGYRISNIDLNHSEATRFCVLPGDTHTLIPPFKVVDGLGENVARSIVAARNEHPFISKQDLIRRTQLSKSMVEKLDKLGALGDLGESNQMTLF